MVSVQWSKMTTCPLLPGFGLIMRSPNCSWSLLIATEIDGSAIWLVTRPGPGSPSAIETYPEQSRRYPWNQVEGSELDRYGTGPPFHAVSQDSARARIWPVVTGGSVAAGLGW